MKKIIIAGILLFIIVYPPTLGISGKETTTEAILNYQVTKNEVLKYQVETKISMFNDLYKTLTEKK